MTAKPDAVMNTAFVKNPVPGAAIVSVTPLGRRGGRDMNGGPCGGVIAIHAKHRGNTDARQVIGARPPTARRDVRSVRPPII